MSNNKKICPHCGKEIPALADFCPECGLSVVEEAATAEERLNMIVEEEPEEAAAAAAAEGGESKEEFEKRMAERRESYQKALDDRRKRQRRMVPVVAALIIAAVAGGGYAISRIMNTDLPVTGESATASLESQVESAAETPVGGDANGAVDASNMTIPSTIVAETTIPESSSLAESASESASESSSESTSAAETTTAAPSTVDTSNAKTMYTTTWLNVRSGPSGDSSVIGTTDNLEALQVLDASGNWYKIAWNGREAYVYSGYVESSKEDAKKAIAKRESEEESKAEESKKKAESESKKEEEEEEETKKSKGTDSSSVISDSSSRYLDEDDLDGMSSKELRRARNEIYARHGAIFSDESLQKYFEKKSWYTPKVPAADIDWDDLNKYEQANIDLMTEME